MDLGLSNKVAVVTGGSQGIGKYAAMRMAQEGARVIIVARTQETLDQAASEIKTSTEGIVLPLAADISDKSTPEKIVNAAIDNYGRLDILVNNAGVSMAKPFEDVSDDDWESDFELKVWGAIRLMRKSIPEMRKVGGGRIINVTNLGGKAPGASSMPTSISRAAGIAITKAMSKDLAKDNILVNTVCIGTVKSGQHERRYDSLKESRPELTLDEFYSDTAKARGIPLGRVAETHEAGDVITFLASDMASYLTGVAINKDGGRAPVV